MLSQCSIPMCFLIKYSLRQEKLQPSFEHLYSGSTACFLKCVVRSELLTNLKKQKNSIEKNTCNYKIVVLYIILTSSHTNGIQKV